MGQLKDLMIEHMELRNLAEHTTRAYLYHLREYVKMFRKSPDLLGEEEVRRYLYHLRNEKKTSWSNINIAYSALRFFYVDTLYRDWHVRKIPRPKGEKKLPVVFSRQEVKRLFDVIDNLKQIHSNLNGFFDFWGTVLYAEQSINRKVLINQGPMNSITGW